MRILEVLASNRRRLFEVRTRRETYVFPYHETDPPPSQGDRLVDVWVDPELGCEGFTYELESGVQGSVHIDSVLEYNRDPTMTAELVLYRVTTQAQERFESSPLSAREIARRLETSPTQLYRLLDPTNYTKSFAQMLALLYVLDCNVDISVDISVDDRVPR